MPVFMCRWENGSCSFVTTAIKDAAIEYLDEVGNAHGTRLLYLANFYFLWEVFSESSRYLRRCMTKSRQV